MELETQTEESKETIIKHIIISGGAQTGLAFYGVLKESEKQKFWNIQNIQTIYATSVGSMVAIMLCLKYDWDTLDSYLIKRPWQNIFKIDLYTIIRAFDQRGIFSIQLIEEIFSPLFLGKDIPISVTMKEFYDLTGIELHIFTTELNKFETIDLSHKTHPDWKILDAIYCSSTLPIVFSPIIKDDSTCYIDGGFLLDFPLFKCLQCVDNEDEIFSIRKHNKKKNTVIDNTSSFFDFLMTIINNLLKRILNDTNKYSIKNEIAVIDQAVSIQDIISTAFSIEERQRLIQHGVDTFIEFSEKRNKQKE
jgi:predicted acylesterase/phospholipase RssA